MSTWTLEGELCSLFQSGDQIGPTLRRAGLIEHDQDPYHLQEIENWHPGGAETYIYVFDVVAGASTRRLIIKAFVSVAAGAGRLDTLLERRAVLETHAVAVPKVLAVGQGVMLEEYIKWPLRDHLRSTRPQDFTQILRDLHWLAVVLDHLGFAPLSPFSDLRTDGSRVFVVDFGEDLGGPRMRRLGQPVASQVGPWLRSLGCDVPRSASDQALRLARRRLAQVADSPDAGASSTLIADH